MLLKTNQTVFVAATPGRDYQPYSKTCPVPVPPHVKRWVKTKICGTYTTYVFFAYYTTTSYGPVHRTVIDLPGFPETITNDVTYIRDFPQTEPTMIAQGPYCVTVKKYE